MEKIATWVYVVLHCIGGTFWLFSHQTSKNTALQSSLFVVFTDPSPIRSAVHVQWLAAKRFAWFNKVKTTTALTYNFDNDLPADQQV